MNDDNRKVLMTSSTIIIGVTHIVRDSNARLDTEVADFAERLKQLIYKMRADDNAHGELMRVIRPLVEIKVTIENLKTEMSELEEKCVDILTKIALSYDHPGDYHAFSDIEPTLTRDVESVQNSYDEAMGPLFANLLNGANSLEMIDHSYRSLIQETAHSIGRENVVLSRESLAIAVSMAQAIDEVFESSYIPERGDE